MKKEADTERLKGECYLNRIFDPALGPRDERAAVELARPGALLKRPVVGRPARALSLTGILVLGLLPRSNSEFSVANGAVVPARTTGRPPRLNLGASI